MSDLIPTIQRLMKRVGVLPEIVDALDPDAPLARQGVDSIDYPLTVIAVQHHFKITLSEEELIGVANLADFAAIITRKMTEQTQTPS